jgi:NADH dehydrogenase [ubiquinone] 1 alpha subcomplex assembly factor 7
MTPLGDILLARIRATGPITLADYMGECLLHPRHGYYTTRDPFGAAGDFTTAPEISQMFGELLGLCLAQSWLDQGSPDFTLAELGPGRGTLMADLLRATRAVPGFHTAMTLCLIEASPHLRARQKTALAGHDIRWLNNAGDLPQAPLFLIANEFFDALPIRQFQREGDLWRERLVCEVDTGLGFGLTAPAPVPALTHCLKHTDHGQIVEYCPAAAAIIAEIGARIAGHGGAALILDYGDWHMSGDTFQALKSNAFADPFAAPGEADLTAHVDFSMLANASPTAHAFTTQGALLRTLGIETRAARLARSLTGPALQSHLAATRRLTEAQEMGTLFKVLALHPASSPPPPGMA